MLQIISNSIHGNKTSSITSYSGQNISMFYTHIAQNMLYKLLNTLLQRPVTAQ